MLNVRFAWLLLALAACGRRPDPPSVKVAEAAPVPAAPAAPAAKAPVLELATRDHVVKASIHEVPIKARVPAGWELTGDNTFMPHDDHGDFHLEFTATCDGACTPDLLPGKLEALVKRAPEAAASPNHNTGDPALDAVRLDIKVVDQGTIPGGHYVAFRQTRPAGLDAPSYMDTFRAVCGKYKPGADVFVYASARATLASEKDLWPLVLEACKTWELQ